MIPSICPWVASRVVTLLDICLQQGRIATAQGSINAREKTHALVEARALSRHAGGLKRPRGRRALCSTYRGTSLIRNRTPPRTLQYAYGPMVFQFGCHRLNELVLPNLRIENGEVLPR